MYGANKLVGITLYFIGIGIWVILLGWLLICIIPTVFLFMIAGYLLHTRHWPEFRTASVWERARNDVFNFKVYGDEINEDEYDVIIWAIYPHGHFSLTAVFYWALNPKFIKARAVIHSALFYLPVFGTFAKWINGIHATESCMRTALEKKESLYMCPGGISDIANTGNNIKKRYGFLRIAKELKSAVVPVWCPDERSYYTHWLPFGDLTVPFLGFPLPMFVWGLWAFPLWPNPVKQSRIYIGTPILYTNDNHADAYYDEISRLQELAIADAIRVQ